MFSTAHLSAESNLNSLQLSNMNTKKDLYSIFSTADYLIMNIVNQNNMIRIHKTSYFYYYYYFLQS